MRLITYTLNGKAVPGLLSPSGSQVFVLSRWGYPDALSFIAAGEQAWQGAAAHAKTAPASAFAPLGGGQLLPPIQRPGKILCVGLNYRDHAIESKMELPKTPAVFTKFPNALIGSGANIVIPKMTRQPDYEAEFAIVIGKRGVNVTASDWEEYVFGYTILNDVSARDVQLSTSQWSLGKSFNTFAPLGPAIVSKDEIPDPHSLDIKLSIDGEVLQHSNTRELIFKAPDLIAYLSSIVPLEPGDVISTGTPAGVGLGRTPQRWLRPGETVTIEVEGIGTLTNPVVAA
jgi:2-keto-4-pentenoate hydratase/2-oxohepta-3-ene-1,7-dioic acid hydratase in catechol pathway